MPTSSSRKTWEARSKKGRASEHIVELPAQGIAGALSNLSENTFMLNRDPGRKKSSGDVEARVKEPQMNPGLVLLSTVSSQITERQQQDSAPQQKPEEGSKNMMDLERKANQHLCGNIVMDRNAQFDFHSQSKISWHNDAHHYSHRRNMMERIFFSFGGKEPSSPEYHEQLLRLTKQLELKLYQSAPSFEAYLDMFTASRLKQLAIQDATETWPSCAQLVKAAIQSTERNELQRQYEHSVAALQKEIDHVNNEKITVDAQLNEALVELKAKESLIGDKEEALEQLQLLQQQRDTEVKSLKLQVLTTRAENTTLAAEKANAVDEATRATLESKSLLEDVQALNFKYNTLNAESQSMNLKFKAMEKDVVDCFLKDRKIKALEDKIEALINAANEAVVAKADVVVQLEEATRALLARDSEIEAREQKIDALTNEVDVATAAKLALESESNRVQQQLDSLLRIDRKEDMKIGALTNELDEAVTAKLALESESNRVQQQLDSLLRIDRKEDMKQLCKVIELNERLRSLQQAHDDALSSLRHEHDVVLSEKRLLEQTILSKRSMSNEGRVSSRSSLAQKALLLFQAGVSILTNNTSTSGYNLDTSETDTETTISSRIDSTRSEQLPIAALSLIQGSMVNEVEYNAGAVMKQGRKRTHMDPVSDGSDKSNKSPRL